MFWEGTFEKAALPLVCKDAHGVLEDLKADIPHVKAAEVSKGWPNPRQDALPSKDSSTALSSEEAPVKPSKLVYEIHVFGVVVDALARFRAASWDIGSIIGRKGIE